MAFEFTLYCLSDLVKDMYRHNQDIDEFSFSFNKVSFHAILDIGTSPYQLLLGTVSHNWACVLELKKGFKTSMSTADFIKLCEILHLKPGKETFTSFKFLKYVGEHAPKSCSLTPVQPSHIIHISVMIMPHILTTNIFHIFPNDNTGLPFPHISDDFYCFPH